MHRQRLTRQERRDKTRKHLLDATATVITSKGLAATTVEDIVEHAGYTRGAFYSNFASKLDLFVELLKANHTRMRDGLQRLLAISFHREDKHALPHDECHEGFEHAMLWVEARHHALRDATFRRQLNALVLELLDVVAVAMDEHCKRTGIQPSGPTGVLARATLALIDGLLHFDIIQAGEHAGSAIRASLDTFFVAAFPVRKPDRSGGFPDRTMTAKPRTRPEFGRERQHDPETVAITCPDMRAAMDAVYMLGKLNRALRTVQMDMESITRRAAGSDDLTVMHWPILVHLLEEPTCRQIDLRSHTGIAPPHLTKLLDELVARGFVRRDKCPQDRRQFILTLTGAGRDTCMSLLASWKNVEKMHPFGKIALILNEALRELENQRDSDRT